MTQQSFSTWLLKQFSVHPGHHLGMSTTAVRAAVCIDWLMCEGELIMARKNANTSFEVKFGETYFVPLTLGQDDLARYEQWLLENESDLNVLLQSFISAGDKFSLSYDLANDCIVGSLTVRDRALKQYGAVITSRSEDAFDALALTLYKRIFFFEKCEKDVHPARVLRG